MPYKDAERQRVWQRGWYARNRAARAAYAKTYRPSVKERDHENGQRRHRTLRDAALSALGGRCVRCGFADSRALQIDHISGGGVKERARDRSYGWNRFYRAVVNGDRCDIQLLCANCNWIKKSERNENRESRESNAAISS